MSQAFKAGQRDAGFEADGMTEILSCIDGTVGAHSALSRLLP